MYSAVMRGALKLWTFENLKNIYEERLKFENSKYFKSLNNLNFESFTIWKFESFNVWSTGNIQKQAQATPQQHGKFKSEQEFHHSNTANQKVSRSFNTATRDIRKRAGASPQQHN